MSDDKSTPSTNSWSFESTDWSGFAFSSPPFSPQSDLSAVGTWDNNHDQQYSSDQSAEWEIPASETTFAGGISQQEANVDSEMLAISTQHDIYSVFERDGIMQELGSAQRSLYGMNELVSSLPTPDERVMQFQNFMHTRQPCLALQVPGSVLPSAIHVQGQSSPATISSSSVPSTQSSEYASVIPSSKQLETSTPEQSEEKQPIGRAPRSPRESEKRRRDRQKVCPICKAKNKYVLLKRPDSYNRHMKRLHGTEPLNECKLCPSEPYRDWRLDMCRRHIRTEHKKKFREETIDSNLKQVPR